MQSCKMSIRKYMYSEETYNLLNNFTLTIKDPDIQREYSQYRTSRFNKLFWPQAFMYGGFITFGWLSYFTGSSEAASA